MLLVVLATKKECDPAYMCSVVSNINKKLIKKLIEIPSQDDSNWSFTLACTVCKALSNTTDVNSALLLRATNGLYFSS